MIATNRASEAGTTADDHARSCPRFMPVISGLLFSLIACTLGLAAFPGQLTAITADTPGDLMHDSEAENTSDAYLEDNSGTTVSTNIEQEFCVPVNPLVAISPSESQQVAPGASITYAITITNTVNDACNMTSFDLAAYGPDGWSIELDSNNLQILPGASGSANILITSPLTEVAGFHEIMVTASESNDPSISGSATATYVIESGSQMATCIASPPQVSLLPLSSHSANAGSAVNYVVSIENMDSMECSQSTFTLNYGVPEDWAGNLSPSTLPLMPGETGTAALAVISSEFSKVGTYAINLEVTSPTEAVHTAAVSANYTVAEVCVPAATNLSIAPAIQSGIPGTALVYTVSLTNNDSADCGTSTFDLTIITLPVGWEADLSPKLLSLSPGVTGSATLSVTSTDSAADGRYNLQVAASDALEPAHTMSTTANYVVQ